MVSTTQYKRPVCFGWRYPAPSVAGNDYTLLCVRISVEVSQPSLV